MREVIKSGLKKEANDLPFYPFKCELCGCYFKAYNMFSVGIDFNEWGNIIVTLESRCPECHHKNSVTLSKREFLRKYKKIKKQYEKEKIGREWELENDQRREILSN